MTPTVARRARQLSSVTVLAGCAQGAIRVPDVSGRKTRIVTTTNFITDLARQVGGDRVAVEGLMGPGVDPHLYKASARDVRTLRQPISSSTAAWSSRESGGPLRRALRTAARARGAASVS